MKFKGPMLVVKDIEKTKAFYTQVLGVRIISDMGENVTITGGLSFQTEHSWQAFTHAEKDFFRYQGHVAEMYFETEDFEGFLPKLTEEAVELVGEPMVMPYGQKVVRFYDPDKHIVEVGEDLKVMMKRLQQTGLSVDELAEKTFMPKKIIEKMLKD